MGSRKKALYILCCAALAAVVFVSAAYVAGTANEHRQAKKEYEALEGEVTDGTDGFTVDFDALQAVNPDIIAWVRFPNLGISYPVVQGDDNSYYLTHTSKGTTSSSGSIFMDYRNSAGLSDMCTVIYGHNMRNGTMFGLLHRLEREENWEENQYFILYTPDGAYQYDIFSCFNAEADDVAVFKASGQNYTDYVSMLAANALYDTGVTAGGEDKVVVLSTCTSAGRKYQYRFVVCGVYAGDYH